MNLFGPLPASEIDLKWIFIVEDPTTRWVKLFALKNATAQECAKTLIDEVFLRFGFPRRLISDNGFQFVSAVMQHTTYCLGIKQHLIPVYHPQANPVERRNRDLKPQLAILVGEKHTTWPEKLPAISPAYRNLARELKTTDDVYRDLRAIIEKENPIPDITPHLLGMTKTFKQVRETQEKQQDNRKKYADKLRRPGRAYNPGDRVWVATPTLSNA
ncbi:uncharacterized protein K02A2.6-like [Ctenocephalides felis]|uniref:uncharacterized protein K02A2.6-like n=1 Tax=Ctenocephalides felis TaxID=7515 RepID=UPI000E6E1266|nr:uncharacterized protein K02A2.6-like [Ctenocephalides felis]